MEKEPAVAMEPVFVATPSVRAAAESSSLPNGSSEVQPRLKERSGKVTAEQLAAIEDEEVLDKMVKSDVLSRSRHPGDMAWRADRCSSLTAHTPSSCLY